MFSKLFKRSKKNIDELKEVNIEGYKLMAPQEHMVEFYLKKYKYYSRNLSRISKYIESKYSFFNIVDIGANIGDSVALIRAEGVSQPVYSIEGEPGYFQLLSSNIRQFSDVKIFQCYLSEETKSENLSMQTELGTGKLNSATDKIVQVQKLDDFFVQNNITDVKLLKIDTDGFDLKILRGGFKAIKESYPVLFFEYDANYLQEHLEDGISIFKSLSEIGYKRVLFYDNFGKLLISLNTADSEPIQQLHAYIKNGEGSFHYFDVCVCHEEDDDLANYIIQKELAFFGE